jgi:hypothetical protein
MTLDQKRAKFITLAEKRVNRAIKELRLIGNLSNRSNYKYTQEDVLKIVRTLRNELDELKQRFDARDSSNTSFKL